MAQSNRHIGDVARDPLWLPHRYDPGHDAVHFRLTARADHRAATFLTDEYLPAGAELEIVRRADALAVASPPASLHFIFHSAYCCSTLLARAVDREGVAMGLKEPVILNDLVGWRQRGGDPKAVTQVLDGALTLLARPFGAGEAVVIKPSNLINVLAPAMLAMRPGSHALLLHAPLRTYLGSVAKKGMWGRLWVRELLVKLLKNGVIDLGFSDEDYLGLTDLQAAAVGWLAQHALFARMATQFGPARVRTLDSEALVARPKDTLTELARLFGLALDDAAIDAIVAGPVFQRHSKFDTAFGSDDRHIEHRDAAAIHGDEIDKVAVWAEAVAAQAGVALTLGAPLLG